MAGIKIRYTKPNNGLALIPLLHKPFQWDSLKKTCPMCQVTHPVKTVHLWLNDQDECLVSTGVLEDLKKAGMPDLVVVGSVDKPPPLHIGRQPRQADDYHNRRIHIMYQLLKDSVKRNEPAPPPDDVLVSFAKSPWPTKAGT